jgi:hypothetical protein
MPETECDREGRYTARDRAWLDPETAQPVPIMAPGELALISPSEQAEILAVLRSRALSSSYGAAVEGAGRGQSGYLLTDSCAAAGVVVG